MSAQKAKANFTYFEITRPVEPSPPLQRFLEKARFLGATLLDPDIASSVIEAGAQELPEEELTDSESQPPIAPSRDRQINGIKTDRLRVYEPDDITLPLLRYRVPSGAKHVGNFNRTALRVNRDLQRPAEPRDSSRAARKDHQTRTTQDRRSRPQGELYRRLYQSGLPYDIVDQEAGIPLRCDNLTVVQEPYTGDRELSLLPAPEQPVALMLLDQARVCFDGYHRYSQLTAFLVGAQNIHIPFARMPEAINTEEQQNLMAELSKLLPVRLIMGGIQSRHNHIQSPSI